MAGVLQEQTSVFGGDLAAICESQGTKVPTFLLQLMQHIEDECLSEVGIYRLSGDQASVAELKSLVEDASGGEIDLSQEWVVAPVVTDCLKQYLRELPEPLIPSYDNWQISDYDMRISEIEEHVRELPAVNYSTLRAIIKHLEMISEYSHVNKMPPANMGIMFGGVMVQNDNAPERILVLHQNEVLTLMIENYETIFGSSENASLTEATSSKSQSYGKGTSESSKESTKEEKRSPIKWMRATFSSALKKLDRSSPDSVYGYDLTKFCESKCTAVPLFLTQLMEFIEANGSEVQGIYRVAGAKSSVKKLKDKINKGDDFDLEKLTWANVHVAATCLKLYLEELPEPLIPFTLYESLVEAAKDFTEYEQISEIERNLQQLSWTNYSTLKALMQHLRNVARDTSMTSSNLGVIFGPAIMREEESSSESATNLQHQNTVVQLMMDYHESIFE